MTREGVLGILDFSATKASEANMSRSTITSKADPISSEIFRLWGALFCLLLKERDSQAAVKLDLYDSRACGRNGGPSARTGKAIERWGYVTGKTASKIAGGNPIISIDIVEQAVDDKIITPDELSMFETFLDCATVPITDELVSDMFVAIETAFVAVGLNAEEVKKVNQKVISQRLHPSACRLDEAELGALLKGLGVQPRTAKHAALCLAEEVSELYAATETDSSEMVELMYQIVEGKRKVPRERKAKKALTDLVTRELEWAMTRLYALGGESAVAKGLAAANANFRRRVRAEKSERSLQGEAA